MIYLYLIRMLTSLINLPFPGHCASFGYTQDPLPELLLHSSLVKFSEPQDIGQHRLKSFAYVSQLLVYDAQS